MKPIQTNSKYKLNLSLLTLWAFILLFIIVFIYTASELQESNTFNAKTITQFLSHFGPLSSLIYIFIMMLAVVTPIPDSLVTVAGGYIFGPFLGSLFSIIGLVIGTSFDFWLARRLGRNFVEKKFPHSIGIIDRYAKKSGWWTIFIMRVIPSVTFDLIGYSAGLSSMTYWVYIGSTLLGAVPMTLFGIFLGNSLHIKSLHYTIIVIVVGLLGVTLGSYIAHRTHISSLTKKQKNIMLKFPHIFAYYISLLKKYSRKTK